VYVCECVQEDIIIIHESGRGVDAGKHLRLYHGV